MRVAIVGASGNAGTAILERITESAEETEVVGIARRMPDDTVAPYRAARWRSIDISASLAAHRLADAFEGCDVVVHLAWLLQPNHDERVMRRTNIDGTRAVLRAVERAGVRHLVVASSLAAYSPGVKSPRVTEDAEARGISGSHYGRMKGEQEALLDIFERHHAGVTVARVRPGLIFSAEAGTEIGRYFIGPWIPKRLLTAVPLVPLPASFVFQAVHAHDVGDAYWRIVQQGAGGAFNVAAEPVLTPDLLARALGARRIPMPSRVLRVVVHILWSARLLAADPGWVDLARKTPVMSTQRARTELGWSTRHDSTEALARVIRGVVEGDGRQGSPLLKPRRWPWQRL
ncbi:NAD-dependent epimerase/dehydratase family protein [Paramicrobacterium agarici]|uniref:Nucleoside-diphosphate-sugar epimerase n=1 Tax=Paramicrobacterium agarici TaxID=630514 RepID=A0A2A9DWY4_9MICO|nr:NAD-dependent epimerase/dehydratase family protein [Microbacterium agarici]PFG30645.1 nucleoside-diphosphate-sugar epimerase [Microbacterium agarici]